MHEMAITQSIYNIAMQAARDAGVSRVHSLKIRMGDYSEIVPALVQEYFEILAKGGIAEGAQLQFIHVPLTVRCRTCGWQGEIDKRRIACKVCGGTDLQLLTGREFYVESIEAD